MARPCKNIISENIEQQIEKEQERVIRSKSDYEAAVDALQKLIDKRDVQRNDELWKAIIKAGKSYDEILKYIETGCSDKKY